jgi:hypothetical protein
MTWSSHLDWVVKCGFSGGIKPSVEVTEFGLGSPMGSKWRPATEFGLGSPMGSKWRPITEFGLGSPMGSKWRPATEFRLGSQMGSQVEHSHDSGSSDISP